jgi:PII-like signaling protein
MRQGGEKVLMRIFIGESDRHGHRPLHEARFDEMMDGGLVTLEKVTVIRSTHHRDGR